jgi:hypothetical protein
LAGSSTTYLDRDPAPHALVRQRSSTFFDRLTRGGVPEEKEVARLLEDRSWALRVQGQDRPSTDSTAPSVVKSSPQSTQPSTRQTSVGSSQPRRDSTRRSFLDPKPRLDMNIIR